MHPARHGHWRDHQHPEVLLPAPLPREPLQSHRRILRPAMVVQKAQILTTSLFPISQFCNLFFKVRRLPRHRVQLHGHQLRKGSNPLQLRGHPFHFGIAGEPRVVGGDEGRLHPLPVRGLGLPHPPGSLPRPCRGRLVHRPAGFLISSKTPSTYPRNCVTKIYDSHLSLCADVQTAERKLLKLVRKIMINRLIFF